MDKVLVITDSIGFDIGVVKNDLEKDKHDYEIVHDSKCGSTLEKKWKAIILLFDSVSKGRKVAEEFRKHKLHDDTHIVYWLPSPMNIKDLSLIYPLDCVVSALGSVLTTRAELKKTAA